MAEQFQLRDVFNPAAVERLAGGISRAWPEFKKDDFITDVNFSLPDLNFGDRNKLIINTLKQHLPAEFPKAAEILVNSLGPKLKNDSLEGVQGFEVVSLCGYISRHGLNHFDISMNALREMTMRFTAEGDIRPFIVKYPEKSIELLKKWAKDPNCHVRRLVSEGTRPRLPLGSWLEIFRDDPGPVIKLLKILRNDEVEYVRRSVANNLNDISKDNPGAVVKTLKKWLKKNNAKEMQKLVRHALRTLLKQGNPQALMIVGYGSKPEIKVSAFVLESKKIKIGDDSHFSLTIISNSGNSQDLMIDYAVYYTKASGKLARKVFKLRTITLQPDDKVTISKKLNFRQMTTRKHYAGQHLLEIIVNGESFATKEFHLYE